MAIVIGRILVINTINDFIPFTSVSARIFTSEQDNEDKGEYPTNGYISEHNSMPEPVPRCIFGSINIGCHRTIQVAADGDKLALWKLAEVDLQSDGHTESHTAFI